jgi:hypothetical protein
MKLHRINVRIGDHYESGIVDMNDTSAFLLRILFLFVTQSEGGTLVVRTVLHNGVVRTGIFFSPNYPVLLVYFYIYLERVNHLQDLEPYAFQSPDRST